MIDKKWYPLTFVDNHGIIILNDLGQQRDGVLLQYTGLKDRNGKEVYESDIVKCTEGCSHQIIWLEERGGIFWGGMPGWYLSGLDEGYAWTGEEEVIGNIYENPELLTNQK